MVVVRCILLGESSKWRKHWLDPEVNEVLIIFYGHQFYRSQKCQETEQALASIYLVRP